MKWSGLSFDMAVTHPYLYHMNDFDPEVAAPRGGPQNPVSSPPLTKVVGGNDVLGKGIVSDVVTSLVAHPGATAAVTAIGVAGRAGAKVVNNAITQRGETRREELRQQGETERARIAQQGAAPQQEPPGSE
jgi:hypothetical protein